MDGIVAGMSGPPQRKAFHFPTFTAKAGGSYQGAYPLAGFPGASATQPPPVGTPGTVGQGGAVPLNADSRVRFTNPTSPALTYLARMAAVLAQPGSITLFDRLWHNSGLSGTLTSAQNVNSMALTRPDALGADTELWLQVYTPTGVTQVTATASYTNDQGVAGRTATAILISSPIAGQMIPFTLQSGDYGVRSVQTVTLSATTGTAGNWGLVILRRITTLVTAANGASERDVFDLGMPQIHDSACLDFVVVGSSSTMGPVSGDLELIQG